MHIIFILTFNHFLVVLWLNQDLPRCTARTDLLRLAVPHHIGSRLQQIVPAGDSRSKAPRIDKRFKMPEVFLTIYCGV